MNSHKTKDLISSRRSRHYNIEGSVGQLLKERLNSKPRRPGFYEYMLIEDVGRLLPFGRGLDKGFTVKVIGRHATRAESLIHDALSIKHDHLSLANALIDFLSQAAQFLVLYGPQTYEIDYLFEAGSSEQGPVAFRFESLQYGSLGRVHGKPIQYVPQSVDTRIHKSGLNYIELDPDQLITFHLSKTMERDVRGVVDFLSAASQQRYTEFALMEKSALELTSYDSTLHKKVKGELLLEATQPIGWAARGLYKDHVLDPYDVWRRLQFKRFKIGLRDSILGQLNAALTTIGTRFAFEAQIELSGVPTVRELDAAEADFLAGRRSLIDLKDFAV